jgi:uroporphyrinogen decarboxylase
MIHRERVLHALRGEPTDRIPRGEFYTSDEFVHAFLNQEGVSLQPQDYQAVVEQLDLDIASVPFSAGWGTLEQPDEDRALEALLRWRSESDRFIFALIDGPFSAAVKARGFDMLMRYVHSAPQFARQDFQQAGAETRVIAQAVRDAGADGVILGEDMAYNKSTFFSPAQLRELFFPVLRDVVRDLRALGLAVFFHSEGNLNLILDDLAACGLNGIQGLEPEAGMQIGAVRQRIGPTPTLWGNLSFEFLSVARTEAEIATAVQDIETANGGRSHLIVGSCGGLVQGLNVSTVKQVYR